MCAEIIDGFDDSPDYSKMVFQNSDVARIPTCSVFQKLDVVRILSRKNRFGIEFFLSRKKKKKMDLGTYSCKTGRATVSPWV